MNELIWAAKSKCGNLTGFLLSALNVSVLLWLPDCPIYRIFDPTIRFVDWWSGKPLVLCYWFLDFSNLKRLFSNANRLQNLWKQRSFYFASFSNNSRVGLQEQPKKCLRYVYINQFNHNTRVWYPKLIKFQQSNSKINHAF